MTTPDYEADARALISMHGYADQEPVATALRKADAAGAARAWREASKLRGDMTLFSSLCVKRAEELESQCE